jgi:two-component system sensor histidine kinase UhpB
MPRILIVDDEKVLRNVLGELLKTSGYEVCLAADAREAVELFKANTFDIVLTDIFMPGVNGVELLSFIRETDPRIQVILMTGAPNVETASAAVRAGAFDYLVKPTANEAVLRCVGNAARLKRMDDERERLEEANRAHLANLEQVVQERTALLLKKSTQLSLSIQAANIGLWDRDLCTGQVYFSPEWKSQIGYRDEELQNCQEVVQSRLHPDDRDGVRAALRDACEKDQPIFAVEFRLRHKDGTYRWLLSRGEVIRDDDQAPCRMLGCQIDITKLKQAEEQLLAFSRRILAVREEERRSLAAALHHDVGSLAVGLSARLDAVESSLLAGRPDDALETLKYAQNLFIQSVACLKRLAVDLHPIDLDLLGLPVALRQHFEQVTRSTGMPIRFDDNMSDYRVRADEAILLFRIAQESVTNTLKHAHATLVEVRVSSDDAASRLTIHDDGVGFDVEQVLAAPGLHLGLRAMREMACSVGADWKIWSERGQGTTLTVVLPKTAKEGKT